MLGDERLQSGEAEHLPLGVVGLYQAVSVEEGAVALLEYYLLLLIFHPRHKPKGHPSGPQFLSVATVPQVGQVMSSVGIAKGTAIEIKDSVEAGYEHVGRDAGYQRLIDSA